MVALQSLSSYLLSSRLRLGPLGLAKGYQRQAATDFPLCAALARCLGPLGLAIGYQSQAESEASA